MTANPDLASRGPDLAKHHADGRAFAGAIVSEQTVNLARWHLQ